MTSMFSTGTLTLHTTSFGISTERLPLFQKQIREGGPVTVTNPDVTRYFMSIPEASQLILQAGSIGSGGEIFILDMGKPIKIIDIANKR